ncbi:MAG: phosphate starvation-inducible protein PhoH, partial [Pseudomonadota bacterium]
MPSAAFDPATIDAATGERVIEFPDNMLLIDLCGGFDRNLAAVEQGFEITIARRGNQLSLHGEAEAVEGAEAALRALYDKL